MIKKTLTGIELKRAQRIGNPCVKRLYSLQEAAEYLGRSVWGVRELIWSRMIPVVKQDGCRKMYLDKNDLDVFIEKSKMVYN
jgi:excisionase family DNA binding protein